MKQILLTLLLAGATLTACHRHTFEEQILDDVNNFNTKEAPKRMDMITTLDSMAYDSDSQTLSYFYTIEEEIGIESLAGDEFKRVLGEHVRTSIPLKAYKEHGLNFHFKYLSQKSGKPLVECTFTPEEYSR